ncbi:MAG: aspartate aminotransferase family protein [Alphaproteobacteria bacterium]
MEAVLPVYRRSDIQIVRGEGVYLYCADGARYLDFAAGIAVNALGHCHPHVVAALKEQADQLWHCSNVYRIPGLERLAARYCEQSFADRVFFCNSGTEAVECGLKMIRKYHHAKGNPQRYRVITMENGFHGRTFACISAGGNTIAREGYGPLLDGFDQVPLNDIAAVRAAITSETAGILIEPIQGEGGVHVAEASFLRELRALCDVQGLLLFFDEVQCGMGRTGQLFAHQRVGVQPDIATLAKGIGNGFPLAACLATEKVAAAMTPGSHGSTYGSNPLAMAVGNAVLDVMLEEGFFAHVQQTAAYLKKQLSALAARYSTTFTDVRGEGLMWGLQVHRSADAAQLVADLRRQGLLTTVAVGNVIRITPPLIIENHHVDEAVSIVDSVCGVYKAA